MTLLFWNKTEGVRQQIVQEKSQVQRLEDRMQDLKNLVDWLQTLGQMKKGLTLVREEIVVKGWPVGQPQETDCMACMDYVTSE